MERIKKATSNEDSQRSKNLYLCAEFLLSITIKIVTFNSNMRILDSIEMRLQ